MILINAFENAQILKYLGFSIVASIKCVYVFYNERNVTLRFSPQWILWIKQIPNFIHNKYWTHWRKVLREKLEYELNLEECVQFVSL